MYEPMIYTSIIGRYKIPHGNEILCLYNEFEVIKKKNSNLQGRSSAFMKYEINHAFFDNLYKVSFKKHLKFTYFLI